MALRLLKKIRVETLLVGIGHPLLDLLAYVDKSLLDKYRLKPDDAILASEAHLPLYEELVREHKVEYHGGGDTLNVMKCAQWLMQCPRATAYIGCIGDDDFGRRLRGEAERVGVRCCFQVIENCAEKGIPTGTCACLITGSNRSLCTKLGAAKHFTTSHLDQPETWAVIEKAKCIYLGGYFWDTCPEAIILVAKFATETRKTFALNLSAPFIATIYKKRFLEVMPHLDILFGNDNEAAAFGKEAFQTSDVMEVAFKLAAMPKEDADRPRIIVFTRGDKPTIVVHGSTLYEFPVIPVEAKDLLDSTGAGDFFVAGFLTEYLRGAPLSACAACGNYAANLVIRRFGVYLPPGPPTFRRWQPNAGHINGNGTNGTNGTSD
jgi:adenosine kinase